MIDSPSLRANDIRTGDLIEHYRLLECIGRGGQAQVWSALDEPQNRLVAVKLLELTGSTAFELAAVQDQVGLIASLKHPHVLPLQAVGYAGDLHYQVVPFVASGSLRDLLDTRALSLSEFARLATQIADALHFVHQRQVVHRDLKSSNVLVDYNRRAFLADFGLARLLSKSTQALHTGRGTPPYSPPEQHAAAKLTPQSDIYSLGILFFEMLTRQLPWKGERALGILQLSDPATTLPDPQELNPGLPAETAAALRALTAADPNARPRSAVGALMIVLNALQAPLDPGVNENHPVGGRAIGVVSPEEADAILRFHRQLWLGASGGQYPLTLTRFCLLDAFYDTDAGGSLLTDPESAAFMLHGALVFGRRSHFWWAKVPDPRRRWDVCVRLLKGSDPAASQRALQRFSEDADLRTAARNLPASIADSLVALLDSTDQLASQRLLLVIQDMLIPPSAWRPTAFSMPDDLKLAQLALEEGVCSGEAARLIGAARSEAAVVALAGDPDSARSHRALSIVLETAGSLPSALPRAIRWRVLGAVLHRQIATDPGALFRAYFTTALGCLIGFGAHFFVTYRLPSFWDAQRLLISLERGVFLGALFGFGLFISQAITRRLTALPPGLRWGLSIAAGSLCLLLALFSYDILFLDLQPRGWLILLGCMAVAASFGLSPHLLPQRWQRMVVNGAATWLALTVSWTLFLATRMHPLLFYEIGTPAVQVWGLALATTLPIAVFGNWVDVRPPQPQGRAQ